MPLTAPMQTGSETTATRNELPAWYTQYGQQMTGHGLNLANENISNYQGYSTNGVWNPTIAGMSGNEMGALQMAAGGNVGNWQGAMDTGMGTLSSGLGQIGAASGNFDSAGNYIGGASNNFNTADSQVNSATGNFNSATGAINSATGSFNTATGNINSATSNFNNADSLYGQAGSSYGQALGTLGNVGGTFNSSGQMLDNAGNVINAGTGILGNAMPALGNAGSTLDWATGNLNPAFNQTTQGGSTLYADANNQRMLDAYLNPYRTQVADEVARLANQNLFENVVPQINTTFVGDGQFGSTRNSGFMNNAVRDNQANVTGAQAQILLAAMNEAQKNYGLEKDRQLQSGRDLGVLSQIGGQLGSHYIDQATGFINAANANTNIGQALNQNAGLRTDLGRAQTALGQAFTDVGRAQTDTGLASTQTGNARVNQGLANKSVGDSLVNQGLAHKSVGDSVVNQGLASKSIGDSRVNQGSAMTQLGNARVNQGQATGQIGFNQAQIGQMRNAAGINDINALLATGGVERGINQAQLDSNLALWKDWRDHPINSLGALSQVLPNVSGRIVPDTVGSTGYTAAQPDVYKNLQEIIAAINGRA